MHLKAKKKFLYFKYRRYKAATWFSLWFSDLNDGTIHFVAIILSRKEDIALHTNHCIHDLKYLTWTEYELHGSRTNPSQWPSLNARQWSNFNLSSAITGSDKSMQQYRKSLWLVSKWQFYAILWTDVHALQLLPCIYFFQKKSFHEDQASSSILAAE